ncbi:hypothetical protein B0H66DRAFT_128408 [Apodospora peruviana]|uniref:Uncharacterized protein n=1 Tax=Apodospora peruviana TaxID=516989 RepID=A0AAE0MB15_9PEZI|nr:hypothetical protein B0H66DRAFT_128408 [Apodospora peruviana]
MVSRSLTDRQWAGCIIPLRHLFRHSPPVDVSSVVCVGSCFFEPFVTHRGPDGRHRANVFQCTVHLLPLPSSTLMPSWTPKPKEQPEKAGMRFRNKKHHTRGAYLQCGPTGVRSVAKQARLWSIGPVQGTRGPLISCRRPAVAPMLAQRSSLSITHEKGADVQNEGRSARVPPQRHTQADRDNSRQEGLLICECGRSNGASGDGARKEGT